MFKVNNKIKSKILSVCLLSAACSNPSLPDPPQTQLSDVSQASGDSKDGSTPPTVKFAGAPIGTDADKTNVQSCLDKGFLYRRSDDDKFLKSCDITEGIGCSTTEKLASFPWDIDGILKYAEIQDAYKDQTKTSIQSIIDEGFAIDQITKFEYSTCSQQSRYRVYFVKETPNTSGGTQLEIRYLRIL